MSAAGLLREYLARKGWDVARIDAAVLALSEAQADHRAATAHPGEKGTSVYVIAEEGGRVKVGISDNPASRADAMQTGNSRRLAVLYASTAFARDFAIAVERAAHVELGDWRVHREWFDCDPAVAIAAIHAAVDGMLP